MLYEGYQEKKVKNLINKISNKNKLIILIIKKNH